MRPFLEFNPSSPYLSVSSEAVGSSVCMFELSINMDESSIVCGSIAGCSGCCRDRNVTMKKTMGFAGSCVTGLCLLASRDVMAADIVNYPEFQIGVTGIEACFCEKA